LASLDGLGYVVDYFDRGSYGREDPVEVGRLRMAWVGYREFDQPKTVRPATQPLVISNIGWKKFDVPGFVQSAL